MSRLLEPFKYRLSYGTYLFKLIIIIFFSQHIPASRLYPETIKGIVIFGTVELVRYIHESQF